MGLITSLLTGAPILATTGTPGPLSDFWYGPAAAPSLSGVVVSSESALKLSAFYRGVDLIARALAAVPWVIKRALPDDAGEEPAKDHPRYRLLHRRPNLWQTSAEFRYFGQWRVIVRGNFYARRDLVRGDEVLTPLDPDRMDVSLLATGRRGYRFRPERGLPEAYTQDEIFHVMGAPTSDGVKGLSVIERARVALGRSLAQQEFAARFYSQNATPPFALSHPAKLSATAREHLEASMTARAAGLDRAHRALVLEEGLKVEKLGLSLRDSQFIELEQFGVVDVCRWLGVQPHKVYELSRATFSNIEEQSIEFLTDTMDPWFVFWEQAAERDLIEDPETFSVKFIREGLLRGDLLSRAQAYAQFIQNGVMAENEVREREGLKKFPGLDEPRRSANQDRGGDPTTRPGEAVTGRPLGRRRMEDEEEDQEARLHAIVVAAAAGVVAKETATLRKALERHADDASALRVSVTKFYGQHVATLTDRLRLDATAARRYCARHCADVLASGVVVLDEWEQTAPATLTTLVLGRRP